MTVVFLSFTAVAQMQPDFQQQQQQPNVEVTDNELVKFAETMEDIQEVQNSAQQEMVSVIQENGLDVQTFNEIYTQTQGNPNAQVDDVPAETMENFNTATQQVVRIQESADERMVEAIESNGMNVERYQEIFMAVQQSPELQERLQSM